MNNTFLLIGLVAISSASLIITVLGYGEIISLNSQFDSEILKKELVVITFDDKFREYAYTIQYDVITDEPIRYLSITDYGMTAELIIEKYRIVFNCYSDADTNLVSIINPQIKDIVDNCNKPRF